MRSSPDAPRALHRLAALAVITAAFGCGSDINTSCEHSFLRYDNFGAPFIVNWCRACHSADIPAGMRQQAPADLNFDDLVEIRRWALQIRQSAGDGATMPPAGGPSPGERQLLVEWLACGAP